MKHIAVPPKPSLASKHKDVLVIGGVIVLVVGAAVTYYLIRKAQEKKREQHATLEKPFLPSNNAAGTTKPVANTRNNSVKMGSRGANVKLLQRYLKIYKEDLGRTGPKGDGVDGIFGPKTARAAQRRLKKVVFTPADIAGMQKALKRLGK